MEENGRVDHMAAKKGEIKKRDKLKIVELRIQGSF